MKVQWEYDLVEKPFCEQLWLMGWGWLEGDTDVLELTERSIRDLERLGEYCLMEANQAAARLLLQGTVAEGRPAWDHGWPQQVRFIDFDSWQDNDLLVINQFKIELTSGRGHVIPDAVLFVNGVGAGLRNCASVEDASSARQFEGSGVRLFKGRGQ